MAESYIVRKGGGGGGGNVDFFYSTNNTSYATVPNVFFGQNATHNFLYSGYLTPTNNTSLLYAQVPTTSNLGVSTLSSLVHVPFNRMTAVSTGEFTATETGHRPAIVKVFNNSLFIVYYTSQARTFLRLTTANLLNSTTHSGGGTDTTNAEGTSMYGFTATNAFYANYWGGSFPFRYFRLQRLALNNIAAPNTDINHFGEGVRPVGIIGHPDVNDGVIYGVTVEDGNSSNVGFFRATNTSTTMTLRSPQGNLGSQVKGYVKGNFLYVCHGLANAGLRTYHLSNLQNASVLNNSTYGSIFDFIVDNSFLYLFTSVNNQIVKLHRENFVFVSSQAHNVAWTSVQSVGLAQNSVAEDANYLYAYTTADSGQLRAYHKSNLTVAATSIQGKTSAWFVSKTGNNILTYQSGQYSSFAPGHFGANTLIYYTNADNTTNLFRATPDIQPFNLIFSNNIVSTKGVPLFSNFSTLANSAAVTNVVK
jgi:hypothetical protein